MISNLPELENIMKKALNFQTESRSVVSDSLQPHGLSVQFSCSVMSNSLRPHEPQHTRPPCPPLTPGAYSCARVGDAIQPSHPLSFPFSSCPHSFPASGSFQMSQLFTSDGQSIGVSASTSVLPMNTQD